MFEAIFDTAAYKEGEARKTTYDVLCEARELFPEKRVSVHDVKYLETGMIKATLYIYDNDNKSTF